MRVVDLEIDQAENPEEWAAYDSIAVSEIQKGCTGRKEYTKNDGDKWIMAYAGERAVGKFNLPLRVTCVSVLTDCLPQARRTAMITVSGTAS
jgi:hypothetical protein